MRFAKESLGGSFVLFVLFVVEKRLGAASSYFLLTTKGTKSTKKPPKEPLLNRPGQLNLGNVFRDDYYKESTSRSPNSILRSNAIGSAPTFSVRYDLSRV
jgi:hypothetical protein